MELPRMTGVENSNRNDTSSPGRPLPRGGEAAASRWIFITTVFVLGALYLLQTVSPLRLESDAVDYLSTGAAIADGRALPNVPFPSGYPVVIGALDRAGMGSSFFFILANCTFLGLGIWATWTLFSEQATPVRQSIVVATMLAISVVKSVAAPLPEAMFFGTSLLSVSAVTAGLHAQGAKRLVLFAVSFAVGAFAMSIRLVGIALIPTLLWACLSAVSNSASSDSAKQWRKVAPVAIVVALAAAVLVVSRIPTVVRYLEHPQYWYVYGGWSSPVIGRVYATMSGIGQLITNIPYSRFHSLGPAFAATGFLTVVALIVARPRERRLQPVHVYLACYLAVLAFWPYDSPRLWMPIVPLIAAHVVSTLHRARNRRPVRVLTALYGAWFALTGIAALAYTTRISLSGPDFAHVYGTNGGMATTALHTLSPETIQRYNAQADSMMRRYGGL